MERTVNFQSKQKVTRSDLDNMGDFARESMDHVVMDGITDLQGFVGFSVVRTGVGEVTVAAGRYYEAGKVFVDDAETRLPLNLLNYLAINQKRIVTIAVNGTLVDNDQQPRTFLLDAQLRTTEARQISVESLRHAEITPVPGAENADPSPPNLNANLLAIAYVTMSTTDVIDITMVAANRLPSVKSLNTRLTLVEKRLDLAGSRIDTLGTDISGLAALLKTRAPMSFVTNLALDYALTKKLAELPSDYTAWEADNYLNEDYSDTAFSGYSAYVRDGLHFGNAGLARSALGLLNSTDPRITVSDNMVGARHINVARLSITGKDAEIALANYNVSTTSVEKLTRTRTEWQNIHYQSVQPDGLYDGSWTLDYANNADGTGYADYTRTNPQTGEKEQWSYQVLSYWQSALGEGYATYAYGITKQLGSNWTYRVLKAIEEPYWDTVKTTETVNGFTLGQTFLNAQQGALTKVDLFFTKKAAIGDVHLYLTELDTAGRPNMSRVIQKVSKAPGDIVADTAGETPTTFVFSADAMVKGQRYGLVAISQGAHFLAVVSGNKYGQGQLFQKNNGEWQAGSSDLDLAMVLWFAGYDQTRVEVQLNPVELSGGIGRIEINCDTYIPEGTRIEWEGFIGGVWKSLTVVNETLISPLATRPNIIQLRAILIGTTDSMPMFGIGALRSSVTVSRNSTSLTHISKIITLPSACDTVEVELAAKHWNAGHHTLTAKILVGAGYTTVENSDSTIDLEVPVTQDVLKRRKLVFNLASAVTSFRIRIEATTSDAADQLAITSRKSVAFA
jgi:hypothetical protein